MQLLHQEVNIKSGGMLCLWSAAHAIVQRERQALRISSIQKLHWGIRRAGPYTQPAHNFLLSPNFNSVIVKSYIINSLKI